MNDQRIGLMPVAATNQRQRKCKKDKQVRVGTPNEIEAE